MFEGVWYALRSPDTTECCDCGLVHVTEFKFDGTKILWRSKVDKRMTRAARKREGVRIIKRAQK